MTGEQRWLPGSTTGLILDALHRPQRNPPHSYDREAVASDVVFRGRLAAVVVAEVPTLAADHGDGLRQLVHGSGGCQA